MVNVASEMERQGMTIPLLIGGAKPPHVFITAVKLTRMYSGIVIHVTDGKLNLVPIAGETILRGLKEAYKIKLKEKPTVNSELEHEGEASGSKQLSSYEAAQLNLCHRFGQYRILLKPKQLELPVLR